MKSLVSIIIVNYNGIRWLPKCFSSIEKQDYRQYEVIFVDNASSDGSADWVKTQYPKTIIVKNKSNEGFANGNNRGYRKAKGRYILMLNNDTYVDRHFLTEAVKALEMNKEIGGVQSKILLMEKPDTHDSVGAYLTPTGFLYHFGFGKKDKRKYNKPFDLYTLKGASMLFKREILEKVKVDGDVFDPSYFAYFEETDLCHRIWLAGYSVKYAFRSIVYHKMGATSSTMDNALIQYHSFKNRINTYMKNLGTWHLAAILPVHIFCCEIFVLVCFLKGKFAVGHAVHRAYWWNIINLGKTLKKRYDVQTNIRRVSDEYFWNRIIKHPSVRYYWQVASGEKEYEEII